ncbi:unnamed protein product [Paramecium sonneborni]|uniref:Uncharacterized protein n=1 Tax=Paramecium sonneborni TaxID=65129 RepID=A0A8S1MTY4_9CILI|nr:unnamed protein product [Paramecium sonneborni]
MKYYQIDTLKILGVESVYNQILPFQFIQYFFESLQFLLQEKNYLDLQNKFNKRLKNIQIN